MNRADLGRRLREARKAAGWDKQCDAAKALGLHPVILCYYESGQRAVSVETLFRMCDLYGISAENLRDRESARLAVC